MIDEKINNIPGWMSEGDLEFLYNMVLDAPSDALILEVGSWLGRSTSALYLGMHDEQCVVAIDTWLGQPNLRFDSHSEVLHKDIFLEFMRNMGEIGIDPTWWQPGSKGACYLRMEAADAARMFAPGSVYAAFIDGDHDAVGEDCDSLHPLIMPGGILCGHDYNWGNVKNIVQERFPIKQVIDDIWVADLNSGG